MPIIDDPGDVIIQADAQGDGVGRVVIRAGSHEHALLPNGAGTGAFSASASVSVGAFGAKADGTTDDSAAINAAIAALPATGGIVYFPPGDYAIGSTVNVGNGSASGLSTRQGVYLCGDAAPTIFASGFTAYGAARLKWTGGAAGTMLQINGPLFGWGIANLHLDGQGVAGKGINVISAMAGDSHNVSVTGIAGSAAIRNSTLAATGALASVNTNTMHNYWRNVSIKTPDNASSSGYYALSFTAADSTANTCYDVFDNLWLVLGKTTSASATQIGANFSKCDNIRLRNVHFYIDPTQSGTAYPTFWDYSSVAGWPSDCILDTVDFGAVSWKPAIAGISGVPSGATPNRVINISGTNSGGAPASPALSNLSWGLTASNP